MNSSQLSSTQIAQKAKSNLAFALGCLPKERKRDMITFYAFCRVVDDIADDPAVNEADKERELSHWKKCVLDGTPPGHSILDEALTWLEIHGERPELVEHWRALKAQSASQPAPSGATAETQAPDTPFRRRRRRRRRRGNYGAMS